MDLHLAMSVQCGVGTCHAGWHMPQNLTTSTGSTLSLSPAQLRRKPRALDTPSSYRNNAP